MTKTDKPAALNAWGSPAAFSALATGDPRSSGDSTMPTFMSGRPDWDDHLCKTGVIDLHVCLPESITLKADGVIELMSSLACTLTQLAQELATGCTVHTGMRSTMYEQGCGGQPSWAERLIHAAVNQRLAEKMRGAEGSLPSKGCPAQSD